MWNSLPCEVVKSGSLSDCDDRCERVYTWQRAGRRSYIDFVMVNDKLYNKFKQMDIDENKLKIDIYDIV